MTAVWENFSLCASKPSYYDEAILVITQTTHKGMIANHGLTMSEGSCQQATEHRGYISFIPTQVWEIIKVKLILKRVIKLINNHVKGPFIGWINWNHAPFPAEAGRRACFIGEKVWNVSEAAQIIKELDWQTVKQTEGYDWVVKLIIRKKIESVHSQPSVTFLFSAVTRTFHGLVEDWRETQTNKLLLVTPTVMLQVDKISWWKTARILRRRINTQDCCLASMSSLNQSDWRSQAKSRPGFTPLQIRLNNRQMQETYIQDVAFGKRYNPAYTHRF